MLELEKYQENECEQRHINLGEFDREGFFERIGKYIYEGIDTSNLRARYEMAYKVYQKLQSSCLGKLEPEVPSPEYIDNITERELEILEADISILLAFGEGIVKNL